MTAALAIALIPLCFLALCFMLTGILATSAREREETRDAERRMLARDGYMLTDDGEIIEVEKLKRSNI